MMMMDSPTLLCPKPYLRSARSLGLLPVCDGIKQHGEPGIESTKAVGRRCRHVCGTFAAMAVDVAYFSGEDIGNVSRWLARGFITAVAIYTFSEISGAHLNPAVTMAFLLRRTMPPALGFLYIIVQCVGAAAATGAAWLIFGSRFALGASHPGPSVSGMTAASVELLLTTVVLVTVLVTANEAVVGKDVALAVGFSIAACGLFAGSISGASMNPARSIVPQVFSGQANLAWIYATGPTAGAVLASVITYALCGKPSGGETEAATGKG
jgi:aquaporin Z